MQTEPTLSNEELALADLDAVGDWISKTLPVPTEGATVNLMKLTRAVAVLRRTPAPDAGTVGVKPLVWSAPSPPSKYCSYDHVFADTPIGRYQIEWKGWKGHPGYTLMLADRDYIAVRGDTLAIAKEDAQADYEARIRSALVTAPQEPVADGLTRYEPFEDTDDGEFRGMEPWPGGEWVRFDDVRAMLTAAPSYPTPQPEQITEEMVEFELYDADDNFAAGAAGPINRAASEILHYATVYGQDGPVRVEKVNRTPVDLAALTAALSLSEKGQG